MPNKIKFLDHTGDSGLQVWGNSLEEIFANSAKGMFLIITESKNIKPEIDYSFTLQADSHSELLVYWLSHLNYIFSTEGMLISRINEISIENCKLEASVSGDSFSADKHEILHEIKAVTYHQLILEQQNNGWFAQVIFDL